MKFTKRSINKNGVVELGWSSCYMDGLHLLEASQRMTLGYQLGYRPLMEGSRNQENDVVDHVAISYKVQKLGQRLDGVIAHMLKFNDELFSELVVNDADSER